MKAVVVGGGIIGLSSAYFLRKAGWEVVVTDRTDLSDSCSYGNLGMVVPSHFVPLAAPGIVSQGIRWMFNSRSPFYVRPSLSPALIRWGLSFMKSANAQHVERSGPYLRDINLLSHALYEEMSQDPAFGFAFEKKGILMYFKDPKVGEEEIHLGEKARSMGLDAVSLSKAEVRALEPDTELDILGAVHYRCDAHLYPNKLIPQLIEWLRGAGVQFVLNAAVTAVHRRNGRVERIVAGGEELKGDVFVLAAGSWLGDLARLAGEYVPIMPGKGYSFTLDHPEQCLNIPAILCEARVAITPMDGRMRYGGTMELGAMNDKVYMNRVQGIVQSVPSYFPNIRLSMPGSDQVWFGYRPCSPDGLPYIGYASQSSNLLVAGGHAMMGLSLGPATGKLVAELAGRKATSVAVDAFSATRFQ